MAVKGDGTGRSGLLDKLGLVAAIAVVAGPLLAWLRVVPGLVGFGLYALGGILAVVMAVSALVQSARGRGFGLGRSLALLAAMVFIITFGAGGGAPRINDFATDPADPPVFIEALLIPANAGRDMAYPAAYAETQQSCCPDLRPARLALPPDQAFARAKDLAAKTSGWEITAADPASGRIEVVATTKLFGFHDDIAIRIRPEGNGSRIDVRSKSRDGKGDMGANAERIRNFVAALEAGA